MMGLVAWREELNYVLQKERRRDRGVESPISIK